MENMLRRNITVNNVRFTVVVLRTQYIVYLCWRYFSTLLHHVCWRCWFRQCLF